ncbi:serine/threonine-protein kinase [Streptomyces sp. AS02]|uniref:serine/threonine-protein kinase n=1 Tax=Streptomyces sp. AS02 TaxID=2938946 RepID=UPI00201FE561|nr:serine/threonine-protein kinase [Streptomyces sp. AS02]MCL8017456.1 serine/threonine protein kinase [Streptomyces sp. AS02]
MASNTEEAEPLVGGRYRLSDRIGTGGHDMTWVAEDELLGATVWLRRIQLPAESAEGDAKRARATRMIRVIARQHSPRILSVRDVLSDEDGLWVVMEHPADARALAEVLRESESGPLPPGRVARIGLGVLDALTVLHAAGVTYRRPTPEEILIDTGGRARLLGFAPGMLDEPDPTGGTPTSDASVSLRYLAPELVTGGRPTPAADLFSLGVVLYEAVQGHSPFNLRDGSTTPAVLHAVLYEEPAEPFRAGPLAPVLLRMLAKTPAERPTVDEVAAVLSEVEARPDRWPPVPPTDSAGPGTRPAWTGSPPTVMGAPARTSHTLAGPGTDGWAWPGLLIAALTAVLLAVFIGYVLPSLDGMWWLPGLWVFLVGVAVTNVLRRPVTSQAAARSTPAPREPRAAPDRGPAFVAGLTDAAVFLRPRTAVPPLPPTRDAYLHEAYGRLGPPPAAGPRPPGGSA